MSSATWAGTPDIGTSDTTARTYWALLDAQILAMGWVASSDTGQANLTTATRASVPYKMYETNDAYTKIKLKVVYAQLSGNNNILHPYYQAGYTTNGAGTFTGNGTYSPPMGVSSSDGSLTETTSRNSFISGDTGRLAFVLNQNAALGKISSFFGIERIRDVSGTIQDTGFHILTGIGGGYSNVAASGYTAPVANNSVIMETVFLNGDSPYPERLLGVMASNNQLSSSSFKDKLALMPVYPFAGVPYPPLVNFQGYWFSDSSPLAQITSPLFGSNMNWLLTGNNITGTTVFGVGNAGVANLRLAMRYE